MTINKLGQVIDLARKLFDAEHADTSNADWIWQTYPGLMERYKDLARVALEQVPSAQEAEILNIRLRGLQAQVEDLQRSNTRHRADKNEMATEIAELKSANLSPVLTLKYRVEELENEIKILRKAYDELQAENTRLTTENAALRQQVQPSQETENQNLRLRIDRLKEQLNALQRIHTVLRSDKKGQQDSMNEMASEIAELKAANYRLQVRVAAHELSSPLDKELGDVIRRIYKDMRDTQS